ncbi:hypothetical protein L5L78_17575 [Shewanella sp. SM34]|uniref:hypothetical protein n=1 Tax=unclassified Shewanella TaxID=196818 RepID=UPI0021D9D1DB|nr:MULTISPECIES: hypothetical protein [unclassified Shewanella]MCU8058080.1 hypothetical protein [Shewanella sp. SM35]MCU8066910.1 hypothetical protein [Shewanella sp. SM34]
MDTRDCKKLIDLMRSGRKFGATTYTVKVMSIEAVDAVNDSGKVVVIARNDNTGMLVMNEQVDAKNVRDNGIPLPSIHDINSEFK